MFLLYSLFSALLILRNISDEVRKFSSRRRVSKRNITFGTDQIGAGGSYSNYEELAEVAPRPLPQIVRNPGDGQHLEDNPKVGREKWYYS